MRTVGDLSYSVTGNGFSNVIIWTLWRADRLYRYNSGIQESPFPFNISKYFPSYEVIKMWQFYQTLAEAWLHQKSLRAVQLCIA